MNESKAQSQTEGVITSPPATCSRNPQGIYCTPEYNVTHHGATLKKMLSRGYDAYGYGGFHCHICKKHSPMPHEDGCANISSGANGDGKQSPTANETTK